MQMNDMAGYFKKFWSQRQQIGAGARGTNPLHAAAASGAVTTAPGQTPKTPRPGRPMRPSYEDERMAKRMVELAALAENIKGASATDQVDIDKLKAEALAQLQTKKYDHRAVAKALAKALKVKEVKKGYSKTVGSDADLWEEIQAELKKLQEVDAKPDPLTSQKLQDTAASGLAGFLGPAGPLFHIGRELHQDFKKDGKELLEKAGEWKKTGKDLVASFRKQTGRVGYQYKRWTSKLKNGIQGVIGKLKSWGSSLWNLLTGGRGFGKTGRAISTGARGAGSMLKNPKVLAGLAAAGLAGSMLHSDSGGDEDQAQMLGQTSGHVSSADSEAEAAGVAPGTKKSDQSSVLKSVKGGISDGVSALSGLFDGLGKDLLSRWGSVKKNGEQVSKSITNVYAETTLKAKIAKDGIQEAEDRLWGDVKKWAGSLWEKFKSFIPKGIRNAASSAWSGVKSVLGIKDSPKTGGDGTGNIQSLSMPVPSAGGGRGSQGVPSSGGKAVSVAGGADVAGVNPMLMKNFYAMADEYYQSTGKRIQINSGKRDPSKQAQLYAANPGQAARPGYSMHEYGYALDINSAEANQMASMGLLDKYGFTRPVSGEAWHLEPIAIQGQKAAIRAGKAKMEDAGAIAGGAPPATESEGANNKDLTKSMASATPATDAQKAAQGKYKASDNYGDKADDSTVSQTGTTSATQQAAPAAAAASAVAPSADAGGYERVASRSKIIETDVQPDAPTPQVQASSSGGGGISVSAVPTYLGDMGMLNMNLGAA